LWEDVRRYEERVIGRALRDAGGVVSRAAQLLGFKHHNSLIALLNTRHKNLLHARSPIIPRRRSIVRGGQGASRVTAAAKWETRNVRVLHVEDNAIVLDAVKETLEVEGWRVEGCADGAEALKLIAGEARFDLLLLDCELPGVGGIEIVRAARRLAHRRQTPIIILSASDCVMEAHRAGANVFLRKPEDIHSLVETIAHLLNVGFKQH
jgi:CheY-like chemotaxis protein